MAGILMTGSGRCLVAFLFAILAFTSSVAATEKIVFKRLTTAILKMDGKQVKLWEVYQAEKRGHLVLVQLGRRFLLLDTKEKEILEIEPAALALEAKGRTLAWVRSPADEKTIESEEWSLRSVGPAVAIKVRLSREGRVLEVQLPQRPDLRSLY